jgi:hypothetical protein
MSVQIAINTSQNLYNMFRIFLFKLVKYIIRKHFSYSLKPIYGTGIYKNKPIAWEWAFSDEEYEKHKKLS